MAIIEARGRRTPLALHEGNGYLPHTIGSWVAVDSRDYPWNTIGRALDGSTGKGSKVDHLMTAAEVLEATDLDLEIRKVPLRDAETDETLERLFATALDVDGKRQYFGAVSDQYEVVQPREALSFFDEVIGQADGAHYSAAWQMREKSMMGVTIELPDEIVIDPDGANDRMAMHILGWNSFDGSTGLAGALDTTRLWCLNQLAPIIDRGGRRIKRSFSLRHTKNVRTQDRAVMAGKLLGITSNYASHLDELANGLYVKTMTDGQFEKFLGKLKPFALDGDESDVVQERVRGRRNDALDAWRAPHNANITGTRWGALNVVGEYMEWGRNVNGSPRTGTSPERQRAIGTLVHPTVSGTVSTAAEMLVGMR